MSNTETEDLSESDFDPDDEYANQWPRERDNENNSNTSATEESENESNAEDEGTSSRNTPNVLRELTRNYILEIYELMDTCKEPSYKNALELNKEMQNRLIIMRTQIQALHSKVLNRYALNEERLVDNMSTKKERLKMGIFGKKNKGRTFYIRGNTFFKDENMRNCPNNEDYTKRCKNGEIFPMDFDLVARHIWSISDKINIVRGIKEQIIAEKSLRIRVSNKDAQLATLLQKVGKDFKIDWTQVSSYNCRYRHSSFSCKAMWEVYLQPALKHDSFSATENERLLQAAEKYNYQNWTAIAKEVGKRSDYQCFVQYHTTLNCRSRWQRWIKKDDQRLLEAIEASKSNGVINWSQVAFQFPQKSKASLQQRYQYAINPSVSHAPFAPEEDLLLIAAVKEFGTNFSKLPRSLFPNRSIIQLRSRYNNTLRHRHKCAPWTLEDDKFLLEFVKMNGTSSWKKLEEDFENRHTRISCRQRYYVIQRHLNKDTNNTLENMIRKTARKVRSNVTTNNWQQKVEELRNNPTSLKDDTRKNEASDSSKRKRKNSNANENPTDKQIKVVIEVENEETSEMNNEMEVVVVTAAETADIATLSRNSNTKKPENKKQKTAASVDDVAKVSNKPKGSSERSVIVYYAADPNENKQETRIRPTKKPIYTQRLRANGLRFHDLLKYSFNFQFGRVPFVLNLATYMEEIDKAKDCLGFQMPKELFERSYSPCLGAEYNLNGLCSPIERRQGLRKYILNAVEPGATLEPTESQVPANFSTLATLRALCVLSADYAKRKEKTSKAAVEESNKELVPISAQNSAAVVRFRQRFRNLFYQAAVLSRLPPSSVENQSLVESLPNPSTFYRPLANYVRTSSASSPVGSDEIVKTEFFVDTESFTSVIKTEIDLEAYKETNQHSGCS